LLGNPLNRAEIADEKFVPIEDIVLENFVLIKDNPDYTEEEVTRFKK